MFEKWILKLYYLHRFAFEVLLIYFILFLILLLRDFTCFFTLYAVIYCFFMIFIYGWVSINYSSPNPEVSEFVSPLSWRLDVHIIHSFHCGMLHLLNTYSNRFKLFFILLVLLFQFLKFLNTCLSLIVKTTLLNWLRPWHTLFLNQHICLNYRVYLFSVCFISEIHVRRKIRNILIYWLGIGITVYWSLLLLSLPSLQKAIRLLGLLKTQALVMLLCGYFLVQGFFWSYSV